MEVIMIKIKAGFSGVISTGSYENERPYFEVEEETAKEMTETEIADRQRVLSDICYTAFKQNEKRSIVERVKKEREDIRFYDFNGNKFPSVTSILNWDADFFMPPHELAQYAARGSIIHKQCEEYIKTGEWKDPMKIPECYPDLVLLKKGNLKLSIENYNFVDFLKKYPLLFSDTETTVFNEEEQYAGTFDIKGVFQPVEKPVKDILYGKVTLFDIKTVASLDKNKTFKQLTAYAKCKGNEDVEQLCIIHLKADNDCGFAKPVFETDINKYWALFRKDRENFKKRFGI
jgi:hypothetical protein